MLVEKKLRPSAVAATLRVVLVVVGAGPLWALTAQPSGPAVRVKETSFSRLALTDLLFTQDVLLEGRAMSRVDCSKKCMDTRGCVMTTFHPSPQGPPHHCRLYSTLHQATHPSIHVAGADSFAAGPTIVKNTTSADSLTETEQSCSRDTQSCQTTLTTDIPDEASTVPIQTTLTTDIPDEASTVPIQTTLTTDIPDEASTAPSQTTLTTDIPNEASTDPSTTDGPATTTSPPCRDSTSCTGGYTLKCGRCLNDGSFKTYSDAKQQCSDRLVMPKTLEDLQCVKDFFQSQTGLKGPFWVGAEEQGQFTWSDGTPLPHNSDLWGQGQPSGLTGFHCVTYGIAFGKLEAASCAFRLHYICQEDCK